MAILCNVKSDLLSRFLVLKLNQTNRVYWVYLEEENSRNWRKVQKIISS